MDKQSSPEFQKYKGYFQGRGIPYWAVLDASGKKVHGFAGGQTYDSLVKQTNKYK